MKKFNFIYLALALVGVISLASCEHKYADFTPGAKDANLGVYFPSVDPIVVTAEDISVNIKVARLNTAGDAEVSVRYDDFESGIFTMPKSVLFAAGESEANILVQFDASEFTPGKQYPVLIQLDSTEASQYGVAENIFQIGIAEPWVALEGKGQYRDDFMGPMYGGPSGIIVEANWVQHALEQNRYRIVEPFAKNAVPYIIGGVPEDMTFTTPGYIEFVVKEGGAVEIPSSWLGFKLDVGTGKPEDFYLMSLTDGFLEEGVFWFPEKESIVWHIPDGRGNTANKAGLFAASLPGYEIKDMSISAAYRGTTLESDNSTISAVVEFALGADVAKYRFTVLPGYVEEYDESVEALINESEEITYYEGDREKLSWKLSLEEVGMYTLVFVPFKENGNPSMDKVGSYQFYYPGKDSTTLPQVGTMGLRLDTVVALTGNQAYEETFPSDYFLALALFADYKEVRSIKYWIGEAATLEAASASGVSPKDIVANYGTDATSSIEDLKANFSAEYGYGSAIVGPFNLKNSLNYVAVVSIETMYGYTNTYMVEKELPNATGIEIGAYTVSEAMEGNPNNAIQISFTGAYEEDTIAMNISDMGNALTFLGEIDRETNTLVFDGFEENYGPLFNNIAFYANEEQTAAYGYWACSDAEWAEATNLVFSYNADGVVASLDNYFGNMVFDMATGDYLGSMWAFSPEATVSKVVEQTPEETPEENPEETPAPSKMRSAKSLDAGLKMTLSVASKKASFSAEAYEGPVVRNLKSNVVLGF